MFLILGGVLSVVIGIIGMVNFVNVSLTSAFSRKKEFAVLQSIGMTGKQLKKMLVTEGMFYAFGSIAIALLVSLAAAPFLKNNIEDFFWFCTYRSTIFPVLCMMPVFVIAGVCVPVIVYQSAVKKPVVERLRELNFIVKADKV